MIDNLYNLFHDTMSQFPKKIAIIHDDIATTFEELNQIIDQIAQYILQLNVRPGEHIGLLLEPTVHRIAAILAILKLGNVYMALSPTMDNDEFDKLLTFAKINTIIYSSTHYKSISKNDGAVYVDINDIANKQVTRINEAYYQARRIYTGDLAYLMRTSGSTGTPKIVMGTHSGTLNRLHWGWGRFPYDADDVCCHKTSLLFVDSIAEIFSPLLQGIPLVILNDQKIHELKQFSESIRNHKISHLTLVPSILESILEDHHSIQINFKSIHTWICSGEELTPALVAKFHRIFPATKLINIYGSTEVSADCSYYEIDHSLSDNHIPIGVPIDNMQIEILTEDNLLATTDDIGEIAVAGVGLANGYYNNAQLNIEKFIIVSKKRYYKTGDLGSKNSNGLIYYHGRKDDKINIGGEKYHLNEIRDFIINIPNTFIKAVQVVIVQKRIIAYIVCEPRYSNQNKINILESLKIKYNKRLPVKLITLEKLPVNQSGKIDRIALVNLHDSALLKGKNDYQCGNSDKIKKILKEILNVSSISKSDNFFELGGNSIVAMLLVSRIRRELNIDVNIKSIFDHPTLERFSEEVNKITAVNEAEYDTPCTIESNQLTNGQQHILLSALVSENPYLFNIVISISIEGYLSTSKLIFILNNIWNHHAGLRTIFKLKNGCYNQAILTSDRFPLEIIENATSIPNLERHSELIHAAKTFKFDIENGPLAKAFLPLSNDKLSHLVFVFHHAIIDDYSLKILLRSLSNYYNDVRADDLSSAISHNLMQISHLQTLERKTVQYRNSLKYWLDKASNIEKISLPTDYSARALIRNQGGILSINLTYEIQCRIFSIAKENNTTPYCVVTTVFSLLLKSYSQESCISISIPTSTRGQHNDTELIGTFTNLITATFDISYNRSFTDNLNIVRHMLLEAMEHKHIPLSEVLTGLKKIRSMSLSPLSNVMAIAQSNHNDAFHLNGLTTVVYEEYNLGSYTDLCLIITEGISSIALGLQYDTDLFTRINVEKMAHNLTDILFSVLESPNAKIKHYDPAPKEIFIDQDKLRPFYYDSINIESNVGEEFERNVRLNPNNIAVIHNNTHYSYHQLSQYSNQVAHYLIEHGLKSDELVGVFCCRSIPLIVFILGIIKAGGCFLLFDPLIATSINIHSIESLQLKYLIAPMQLHSKYFSSLNNTLLVPANFLYFQKYSSCYPGIKVSPSNHCYYILTSGTTGSPKIAMNHHRGLLYHIREKKNALGLGSDFRFLQTASVQSDIVIWQIFGPLLTGGLTVILDNTLDFTALLKQIKDHKLTVLQLVPSIIDLFIECLLNNKCVLSYLDSLKWMISIGEVLTAKTVNSWLKLFPNIPIVNAYGPAECADTISMEIIENPVPIDMRIPLGQCFPETTVLILNADGKEVPYNTRGQICISGPGVGYGYYQNESLSASKFICNPRNAKDIIYCTGDFGKRNLSNQLIYLGREDQQHKKYGYRFDLNDITHIVNNHHLIKSTASLLIENKIVLFYVTHCDNSFSQEDLNDFLVLSLPVYAIPDIYYKTDFFKYLPGGKIDLKYLKDIYKKRRSREGIKAGMRKNQQYKKIMSILENILAIVNIKASDNFFKIGGGSLDALRFCNEISNTFGISLTLRDIMLASNIEDLYSLIMKKILT